MVVPVDYVAFKTLANGSQLVSCRLPYSSPRSRSLASQAAAAAAASAAGTAQGNRDKQGQQQTDLSYQISSGG